MSFDDRRSPDYQPQYMRELSTNPSNHQIGTPWFWVFPWTWPCYWAMLWAQTLEDTPEAINVIRDRWDP
jgi:hypothetical protein